MTTFFLLYSIYETALERGKREITNYGEDGNQRKCGVEGGRWRLKLAQGFASQEATVAEDAVDSGERKQRCDQGVEVDCFGEMSAQQGGQSTGGSAAGTLQVKIFMNGTLRIEAVLRGGKQQQNGGSERDEEWGRSRSRQVCDAAGGGGDHRTDHRTDYRTAVR
jgi:hypothetical protein